MPSSRWIPLGLLPLLLATPRAEASDLFTHRTLTESALQALGWKDEAAIEAVVASNQAADLARLPGPARMVSTLLFPVGDRCALVSALAGTAPFNRDHALGFHFNALYTFDAIDRRWSELAVWVEETCQDIESGGYGSPRRDAEFGLLGLVTHAVQDFYAHANWVGLLSRFGSSPEAGGLRGAEFPLWEELVGGEAGWMAAHPAFPRDEALTVLRRSNAFVSADETAGGLQTGRIRGPLPPGIVPWRHRHQGGAEGDIVRHLARRATILWVQRIERRLGTREGARVSPRGEGAVAKTPVRS